MGQLKTLPPVGAGAPGPPGLGSARDLQGLWVRLLRGSWTSLALVPARPGPGARALARELWAAGARLGEPLPTLVEVEPSGLEQVPTLLEELGRAAAKGRALVAIAGVDDPAGLALAQAADRALLCVELGETDLASAERAIAQVGRERFLGCVAVHRGGRR